MKLQLVSKNIVMKKILVHGIFFMLKEYGAWVFLTRVNQGAIYLGRPGKIGIFRPPTPVCLG